MPILLGVAVLLPLLYFTAGLLIVWLILFVFDFLK